MTDIDPPPSPDGPTDLLIDGTREEVVACLDRIGAADAEARRRALRAIRDVASEDPSVFDGLADPLASFLTDEGRAVRLTTAKLFVTLADSEPGVVLPVVDPLAERLADEEEFYYVRARCAEALGYLGRDSPESVSDPEILADFRIGLSFDEPEVKEKLAKALECVALGDPSRLRHQVESLAEHLDDDEELVRYHLCTALTAIGCEHPAKLAPGRDALAARLSDDDEDPHVRGRAAEALGLLTRVSDERGTVSPAIGTDDDEFVRSRVAFLQETHDDSPVDRDDRVGTLESIRDGTEKAVDAMRTPDEYECPHCGVALPDGGLPMCPNCGSPR
ncbi:hypothetical protein GRX01_01410 [Halobaculum sp. WSA2]|uniref:HEAT repeat-containing protein n=1 Tax=Halobaculum saliterrae TaxID=2073113 RepID=A0A6B0SNQ7_9EURY|nr:HEAT repeat domain-containing protein [Halobaculum saliterrae]MXR40017.1 hypothetical protein [Halobaculum saliterrae]